MLAVTSCFPAACPGSPGGEPISVCGRRLGCNLYLGLFILQDSCQQKGGGGLDKIGHISLLFLASATLPVPSLTLRLFHVPFCLMSQSPPPISKLKSFFPSCCFSLSSHILLVSLHLLWGDTCICISSLLHLHLSLHLLICLSLSTSITSSSPSTSPPPAPPWGGCSFVLL